MPTSKPLLTPSSFLIVAGSSSAVNRHEVQSIYCVAVVSSCWSHFCCSSRTDSSPYCWPCPICHTYVGAGPCRDKVNQAYSFITVVLTSPSDLAAGNAAYYYSQHMVSILFLWSNNNDHWPPESNLIVSPCVLKHNKIAEKYTGFEYKHAVNHQQHRPICLLPVFWKFA